MTKLLLRDGLISALVLVVGVVPVGALFLPADSYQLSKNEYALISFCGWMVVFVFYRSRVNFFRSVSAAADRFGIDKRRKSVEELVSQFIVSVTKKNDAISTSVLEERLVTKEQLSKTLERVVAKAYRLLEASSAELALFDEDSGLYHSAFVLGVPFKRSAQAMLSGAASGDTEDNSPEVVVQQIIFAGTVLGTLRVALKGQRIPTLHDREIIQLLALQGGLALINSRYSEQLLKMRKKSDESVRAKTGFLATLSHEIRGPLGIILNAVELVIDGLCGEINKDQRETLAMVQSNGQHLLELIGDVLDYAKVESGKVESEPEDIDLGTILTDICAVVRTQADTKQHKLICRPLSEQLYISCDRRHFRQILINLLTNAIKYTPDGGKIEVFAERIQSGMVRISVNDSGVGIADKDRHKVFSPFERVDDPYSMAQVGTGLGMPLTKRLVEVNGGQIDFSSERGKGSLFWVIFSLVHNPKKGEYEVLDAEDILRGAGERILLVAKDDGERGMVVRFLSHVGYEVVTAGSQIELRELLSETVPDLVILDDNSLDKVQENIMSQIRQELPASLPIILISSRAFVFDIEKYLKEGIDRYVTKPLQLRELSKVCRELIDGSRGD